MRLSEEQIISKALLQRFQEEADFEDGDGRYYALIVRENGDLLSHHPIGPNLVPDQLVWANAILKLLNRELHHDGAWVICFTHPVRPEEQTILHMPKHAQYARYCLIWIDKDADCQFTVEWMQGDGELRSFADVVLAGIESTVQKCQGAWQLWHHHMREILDPRPNELFRRAQGERAPARVTSKEVCDLAL